MFAFAIAGSIAAIAHEDLDGVVAGGNVREVAAHAIALNIAAIAFQVPNLVRALVADGLAHGRPTAQIVASGGTYWMKPDDAIDPARRSADPA